MATAIRIEQRTESVPANITVIDEAEIGNAAAKTVEDLLCAEEEIVV
ncbi:MAG: hypothetical protein JSV01_08765 [Desulfobacterales bacterium]|nr:MAG: hypothetical protein JSV01_08765 [Desulfobacterales bacterium]UCG80253.1 MAG: hypothetical protein JSV60_09845 [Desulfobacterales bacterium]